MCLCLNLCVCVCVCVCVTIQGPTALASSWHIVFVGISRKYPSYKILNYHRSHESDACP